MVSDGEFRPYIAPAHEGQGAKWTIISHGILYTLADPQPGRQHPRWQEYLDNDRKLLWEGHCASRPRLWSHYYFKDRTSAHNEPFTKNPDKAWLRSLNAM